MPSDEVWVVTYAVAEPRGDGLYSFGEKVMFVASTGDRAMTFVEGQIAAGAEEAEFEVERWEVDRFVRSHDDVWAEPQEADDAER